MKCAKSGLKYLPVLAAIALVIGLSAQALGQSTYGVLVGTVTDNSGSVIPNAGVEARNQGTDVTSTTHTDSQGDYLFVNMDPGGYTITVSAQSFAVEKNESVVLPARETVRADFKLQVQSVSQQVVVTSRQEVVSEDLPSPARCRAGRLTRWPSTSVPPMLPARSALRR